MTMLQQTLVSEQLGRVTNALGWCVHTPPAWAPAVVTPEQLERWILPTIRGERHECYAITEEGAGSDVDAIASTVRRDGDEYVLNGVKMHVTSFNTANFAFFQGKIADGDHAGEHAMLFVDHDTPGVRVVRVPRYSHTYADQHPIVAFDDVRVPADEPDRARGRRAGVHVRMVPVRAADDRRPMLRRRRAPDRRGHGVRQGAGAVRPSDHREPGDRAHARRFADRAVGRAAHDVSARREHRRRARREAAAHAVLDGQALRERDGRDGSPTARCRSSAVAATCARTWRNASSASSVSIGSGKGRPRSNATSSPISWPSAACSDCSDSPPRLPDVTVGHRSADAVPWSLTTEMAARPPPMRDGARPDRVTGAPEGSGTAGGV